MVKIKQVREKSRAPSAVYLPIFPATLRGGRTTTEAAQQHLARPLLPGTGPRRGRRMLSYTRASLSQEEEAEERQLNLEASLATETTGLTDGYCALCTSLQVAPHSGVLAFVRLRLPELRPLESEGFGDRDMFAPPRLDAATLTLNPYPEPTPHPHPRQVCLLRLHAMSLSLTGSPSATSCCVRAHRPRPSSSTTPTLSLTLTLTPTLTLDHSNTKPHPHPHPHPHQAIFEHWTRAPHVV